MILPTRQDFAAKVLQPRQTAVETKFLSPRKMAIYMDWQSHTFFLTYARFIICFSLFENSSFQMASLPVPSGGDQDRGGSLIAMVWTEVSIAIVVVMMRMFSRFKINGVGTEYVHLKSKSIPLKAKIES